jgi:hypothetical protein
MTAVAFHFSADVYKCDPLSCRTSRRPDELLHHGLAVVVDHYAPPDRGEAVNACVRQPSPLGAPHFIPNTQAPAPPCHCAHRRSA